MLLHAVEEMFDFVTTTTTTTTTMFRVDGETWNARETWNFTP